MPVLLIFFISSCVQDRQRVIEYYKNGDVKSIKEIKNGKLDGLHKVYYENGNLKFEVAYKDSIMNGAFLSYYPDNILETQYNIVNGHKDGVYKKFYPSGRIREVGKYDNGFLRGDLFKYYDQDQSQLKSKEVLAQFGDKRILIAFEYYDKFGNTENKHSYPYKINFPKGTLKLGRRYNVEVFVTRKKYDSLRLIFGEFNTDFSLKNNRVDTIDYKDNKFSFNFKPTLEGDNILRALIEDFKIFEKDGHTIEYINNKLIEIEYKSK